jgi:spore germination cell wall hydrolase CwlJ-like protein
VFEYPIRRVRRRLAFAPLLLLAFLLLLSPGFAREPDAARFEVGEFKCLATAIYFEARGESRLGQAAVAQVILNRVASVHYPKTVCAVVYQNWRWRNRCQFSFACDGKPDVPKNLGAIECARTIARKALAGAGAGWSVGRATLYHANYVSPGWAEKAMRVSEIGHHIFYIETRG